MDSYWFNCVSSYDFSTKRIAAEEVWSIEGVASGSLYNFGNSCVVDALSNISTTVDSLKDSAETVKDTSTLDEASKNLDTVKDVTSTSAKDKFDIWNFSDGYMMVADAVWTVAATDLSGFTFSFCVSAVGADANCFSGDYTYQSTGF